LREKEYKPALCMGIPVITKLKEVHSIGADSIEVKFDYHMKDSIVHEWFYKDLSYRTGKKLLELQRDVYDKSIELHYKDGQWQ
jgi:hypothetical protein